MKKKLLIIFIIIFSFAIFAVVAEKNKEKTKNKVHNIPQIVNEKKSKNEVDDDSEKTGGIFSGEFAGESAGCVDKPVIYLYPTEPTNVSVKLDFDGILSCTYPKYNDGWTVEAMPDGTLYDAKGMQYDYLFWEGKTKNKFDFSTGYCIKGEDTETFLETKLEELGLNRHEANDFITYWLPKMEGNKYNIISFQTKAYTDHAKLNISPNPDTMIRVFMTYKASDTFEEMKEEKMVASPARSGFTVVEWGGTECK